MKKYNSIVLMLSVPLALSAQMNYDFGKTESFSSVVKVVDNPMKSIGAQGIGTKDISADNIAAVPVVSAVSTDNASLDLEKTETPSVAANTLASETEVVLDLPGQGTDSGAASMAAEETISVDFPDEDVRTVLRSVADLFDLNLVIPDSLQGRTSIKLRNITWDQVFEVVLEPLGYTFVEDRNIVRIKSIEALTFEPVDTRIFIANYARAEELKESISPLVDAAAGGSIQVDTRSNALVIKERPSRMGKIQEVIKDLDQPTEQVMIESKFVEVSDSDVENIGINWTSLDGYSVTAGPYERTWERSSGTEDRTTSIDTSGDPPVTTITETIQSNDFTRRLDTALFSADEFNVILSALNTKNDIKLVSNPTVVTLNNTSAKIAIGERYPLPEYAFNAQTGERQLTGFEYIDIGINLDVIPSVNDAGFINLDITPEVSSIGESVIVEGTEIPRINSRRTEANVTIKDGYTLAIGGLSSEDTTNNSTRVPLLGDIPGIGKLFRSRSDTTTTRNLIIFITAKTLDPDGSDYRDVVDPRILNDMQILPSDLPGYELSDEDLKVYGHLEQLRSEAHRDEKIGAIQDQVDLIEEANNKKAIEEEKKFQKESKKKSKEDS